ncbi:MAG: MBL fold metallo-hydrolase [Bacteroidales bacterium]|jgi:glyoxylase-like metal-dependent hydrolase (beta-lactamase superfamily II)|nr:MBL fold metallo-hydrolase [Bacteroidales bacterium]
MENNMGSKFFNTQEIAPHTTAIIGLGNELCYLLEGKTKALLIDTLIGVGNLRAFCRELTDLPITVVNTHGHIDHTGGIFDFDECYIHSNDISLIYEKEDRRKGYVENGIKKSGKKIVILETDFTVIKPMKTFPIYDGFVFDLGERKIEVIAVPGHTLGTVVLLDRSNRIVFSGDACNINTLLFLPHSTSIEEYRESLFYFKEFQPYFDVMWGGHNLWAVPKVIIDEAIELCGEIIARTDDALESEHLGRPCFYGKKKDANFKRLDGKIANIAYSKDKINRNR